MHTKFLVVKLNHNELLTYPAKYNQIMFGSGGAWNLGAAAVGATIYFGSEQPTSNSLAAAACVPPTGMACLLGVIPETVHLKDDVN